MLHRVHTHLTWVASNGWASFGVRVISHTSSREKREYRVGNKTMSAPSPGGRRRSVRAE